MTDFSRVQDTPIDAFGDIPGMDRSPPAADAFGDIPATDSAQPALERGAARIARGQMRGRDPISVPQISDDAGYEALLPGARFKDPKGNERVKPYKVDDDADYDTVPEGADFLDPQGNLRTKPVYEGIDFTTQTLYDMAATDKERQKILEKRYPGGKVTQRGSKFFVDDDGTPRRPKGFTESWTGGGASALAATVPTVGAALGTVGGAAAGSLLPGPGTLVGGVAGATAGGAAGQAFNDIILGLAGVYDRTAGEEAAQLALSGVAGGAGVVAGRVATAAAPYVKASLTGAASMAASKFLGAEREGLEMALKLREQGVMVPVSSWAKEAPHLANVSEVFDPAFRMQKPLQQSALEHYERTAGGILDDLGVKVEGKISDPTAAPSARAAGEALVAKRLAAQEEADARLAAALDAHKATAGTTAATNQQAVLQAATDSRRAAQGLIDQGFADIQRSVDEAARVAHSGHNSGDLWNAVGERLRAIRAGIAERARTWYAQADEASGGILPDTEGLPQLAQDFLNQLPEPFQAKYPDVVRRLTQMAGREAVVDPATGAVVQEAVPPILPTFGQLHEMRTFFRANVNWYDLTNDTREGVYKFFANRIDRALHDPNAPAELQLASRLLDATDRWYGEQIRPLQDARIQAVIKGLESGLPADPKVLFDTVVKEGRTELTNYVRNQVGPNLWAGVRAADLQSMLDASRSLVPNVIDGGKFTREVLDRYRSGMLQAVHGDEVTQQMLQQAQRIAALNGKLDINVLPGDTVRDVIARARTTADAARTAAREDPLGALARDSKRIEADHKRQIATQRRNDPLGFIYDPTVGAAEAVERILKSEDLILAAGARFGENSTEFNMLRQVWAQKILMGTMEPGQRLAKVTPEVQRLMFPGATLDNMMQLAKEMDFLMGTRALQETAKSMAAQAKVEHPWSSIPLGRAAGKIIPGFDAAGRYMLGSYYKMVTGITNRPTLMRFVLRGLDGNAEARLAARRAWQASQPGGVVGAGAGVAAEQVSGQ